jgi:GNAT superfamily N-acetyltransferase
MRRMAEIRQVGPDGWREMREVRLAALLDAPTAFGSTYEDSVRRTDEQWQQRLEAGPMFIAYLDDKPVGLSGGFVEDDGSYELVSMWVDPVARGKRVAEQLVNVVADWARGLGADALHLWVTDGNVSAQRLYERVGFAYTGERQALPSDPQLTEVGMALDLRATA